MKMEELFGQVQRHLKYDCLLFDLDDTLYPVSSGLAAEVLKNIKDYMVEKLGIDKEKIPQLCNLLYKNYGTTMAGIRAIGYDFDYDEYHSYVHGRLPYEKLKSDPVLRNLLLSLPIRKVIFTNADKIHAAKVLSKLGLEDCFEGIICFESLNPVHNRNTVSHEVDDVEFVGSTTTSFSSFTTSSENSISNAIIPHHEIFDIVAHCSTTYKNNSSTTVVDDELPKSPIVCKPSEDAIQKALNIANIDPQRTLFFEDSVRNIQSGKRVGLDTVLVGTSHRCKEADYVLESIHNMKEAIPELWQTDNLPQLSDAKVMVETYVTA
uniref:uncharacterized protein LOC122595118 n=1 Tax=Erigeron canadensis TaxID=72917 RepID=UPI001CB954F4|nr:uncharacterized protein LOC122595118 [Erigeron canadensis]